MMPMLFIFFQLLLGFASGCFVLPSRTDKNVVELVGATSRRNIFSMLIGAPLIVLIPQQVEAKDELFKTNPLTNGVLEQVRVVH